MNIDERELNEFSAYLKEVSGISLSEKKHYLITARIKRILDESNCKSLSELTKRLRGQKKSTLKSRIVDAMTTNETYWFRDEYPFQYLRSHILPELNLLQTHPEPVKIWCAACSSGQEPYSISIICEELKKERDSEINKEVQIVATDISGSMLQVARHGVYDESIRLRGLGVDRLRRHFDPVRTDESLKQRPLYSDNLKNNIDVDCAIEHRKVRIRESSELIPPEAWQLKPRLRERVEFRELNMQNSFYGMGKFDIIFCRNVLIYFTNELKQDILQRLHESLHPGGYLFLGSSEGIGDSTNLFEMVQCNPGIVYRSI